MPDKVLAHNDKGNFEDLKIDAVDPSEIESKPQDARFGLPKFLSWTLKKDEQNGEFWEAKGRDGKVYRIVDDDPKPPKKGKVVII